ncbi:MAG: hypothetical protein ABL890_03665 [Candidatus Peribacteraceae bacterium]
MTDIEVDINSGPNKAFIEGKTAIPFKAFVTLVLQRKVQHLFKSNQDDPIIVGSELLTSLAAAPDDRRENRGKLVLVTMFVGILCGVFVSAATLLILSLFRIQPDRMDLAIVLGVIVLVVILFFLIEKSQKRKGFTEKLQETMEKATDLLAR